MLTFSETAISPPSPSPFPRPSASLTNIPLNHPHSLPQPSPTLPPPPSAGIQDIQGSSEVQQKTGVKTYNYWRYMDA